MPHASGLPIKIGITGSMGMGKSTLARLFLAQGVPVFDCDGDVHHLYAHDQDVIAQIAALCPHALRDGRIDRTILGAAVVKTPDLLPPIEAIVHPVLKARRQDFFAKAKKNNIPIVAIDHPLLFETGEDLDMDYIVVAHVREEIQKQRILARPSMTLEKLNTILSRQISNTTKAKKADWIADMEQPLDVLAAQVKAFLNTLPSRKKREKNTPHAL